MDRTFCFTYVDEMVNFAILVTPPNQVSDKLTDMFTRMSWQSLCTTAKAIDGLNHKHYHLDQQNELVQDLVVHFMNRYAYYMQNLHNPTRACAV